MIGFVPMPNTDHPVIASNLYRMSGGPENNDRFEQVGQSWVKHTFGARQYNDCNFGCQPGGDIHHLGIGCSDIYLAAQGAQQNLLGSRAWINPFTGVFSSDSRDHTGHTHTATSHMLEVETTDLNPPMNPGASYYAELLYVTPAEFIWCQTHPTECNMSNNASYRRYEITKPADYILTPVGATVRMSPAINTWSGAIITAIEPDPGNDGRFYLAYKVTGPVSGLWHYEYAIYNQNLDRAIQSFRVPLSCGATVSNLGFHAPANPPPFPNDGTLGDAGFSNAPWSSTQVTDSVNWATETFAQNQNANAIRWGTLYNFRFDSAQSPAAGTATIGFFKSGGASFASVLAPAACGARISPTPAGMLTPTPTPSLTPSPTPTPMTQALNLSTRVLVEPGDNVGIGGFILTGNAPKQVILRGIGPSLTNSGVPDPLSDPVLELHGPTGFATIMNDDWRDGTCGCPEVCVPEPGIVPTNNLESCIIETLDPGAYTAVLRGKNNDQGVGLVEVYDVAPASSSKLANISTRAFVSTGADIVIAGFILGGNTNDNVILRGIGPTLSGFGVPNTLINPTLELRDNNGALIRSNNDWEEDPDQAAQLVAAGLAPTNNLESGIAAILGPGQYTALFSGANDGTGVGLVEVYAVQ